MVCTLTSALNVSHFGIMGNMDSLPLLHATMMRLRSILSPMACTLFAHHTIQIWTKCCFMLVREPQLSCKRNAHGHMSVRPRVMWKPKLVLLASYGILMKWWNLTTELSHSWTCSAHECLSVFSVLSPVSIWEVWCEEDSSARRDWWVLMEQQSRAVVWTCVLWAGLALSE